MVMLGAGALTPDSTLGTWVRVQLDLKEGDTWELFPLCVTPSLKPREAPRAAGAGAVLGEALGRYPPPTRAEWATAFSARASLPPSEAALRISKRL